MSGKWWRLFSRHFLCIFRAKYSASLFQRENRFYILSRHRDARSLKMQQILAKCENICMGGERGDEREKKWVIEEMGEREANPDLRWGVVPQCGPIRPNRISPPRLEILWFRELRSQSNWFAPCFWGERDRQLARASSCKMKNWDRSGCFCHLVFSS